MSEASRYLDTLEANNHAVLYECRWDSEIAARVVPQLIVCLAQPDRLVPIRALNALYRIGLPAEAATPTVIPLIFHSDTVVARAATMTVAAIGRNLPQEAIPALISASSQPELLKEAMFALIAFESQAREGTTVFVAAYSNSDHRLRKLAIRGLEAVADDETLKEVLNKAQGDRSKAVRDYAHKVHERSIAENPLSERMPSRETEGRIG